MKRFSNGLLLSLLWSISLSAQAFTFEDWQARQAANPAFKSHIEYSRWLAKPEIRIHADGQLYFTPSESLLWQWFSPVPKIDEITITGQRFNHISAEQAKPNPMTVENDGLPSERQIARLLIRAHQGDLEPLKARYDIRFQGEPDEWQLTMLPRRNAPETLQKILFEGGRFINLIRVEAKTGNELRVRLSKHQPLVDGQVAGELRATLPRVTEPLSEALRASGEATRAQGENRPMPKLFPRQADNE